MGKTNNSQQQKKVKIISPKEGTVKGGQVPTFKNPPPPPPKKTK